MTNIDFSSIFTRIPYAATLGVEPIVTGDEFMLLMPYKESNIGNPMLPALHGGAIGGFMELTAIAQLYVSHGHGREKFPKPIGINIDYLRRGKPIDTYARAVIAKHGSRVANVRVQAWQDSYEHPIAALHGHFLLAGVDD